MNKFAPTEYFANDLNAPEGVAASAQAAFDPGLYLAEKMPDDKRLLRSSSEECVLSYGQIRLWTLDRIEGGTSSYNMPIGFRVKGLLDVAKLGEAFRDVVLRHEPLRTVIFEDHGEIKGRLRKVPEGCNLLRFEDCACRGCYRDQNLTLGSTRGRSSV